MDWNNLKVALAISRAGSLTRASAVLGIDTSTAGRRLSALEADLGIMLFVRTKTGFTLTDAGEAAISHVVAVQNRIELMIDEVTESEAGPAGTVRLAGNTWIVSRLAEKAVLSFLDDHPLIDLRTTVCPADALIPGGVSLSLWFDKEPQDGVFKIELGRVPHAFYRSNRTESGNLGWISLRDEKMTNPLIECAKQRLKNRDEPLRFTTTDAGVLMRAVKSGVGKGLLPMCLAEEDEGLRRVDPEDAPLERSLFIHAYHDTVETRRVQATIQWLRESFSSVFHPGFCEPVHDSGLRSRFG